MVIASLPEFQLIFKLRHCTLWYTPSQRTKYCTMSCKGVVPWGPPCILSEAVGKCSLLCKNCFFLLYMVSTVFWQNFCENSTCFVILVHWFLWVTDMVIQSFCLLEDICLTCIIWILGMLLQVYSLNKVMSIRKLCGASDNSPLICWITVKLLGSRYQCKHTTFWFFFQVPL